MYVKSIGIALGIGKGTERGSNRWHDSGRKFDI
jgi:hypothetical protein